MIINFIENYAKLIVAVPEDIELERVKDIVQTIYKKVLHDIYILCFETKSAL